MIIEFSKVRLTQLEEDVDLFNEMGIPAVQKVTGIINAVRQAVKELKEQLKLSSFTNAGEEIQFFKGIKPYFIAIQLYTIELFKIENDKPSIDSDAISIYYQQELRYIRQFFDKHQFIYQYYLLGGNELDASYFIRGKEVSGLLLPDGPDIDPLFSTAADYLFAKFIAYERLQEYLVGKLNDQTHQEIRSSGKDRSRTLKWTGDKSNLVEFAYGLYDTMQINEGDLSIAELIGWLEESFNINLTRHYQIFSEIKNRKSVSRTRFLDHARMMLTQHMEEGDAFKPKPPKSVSGSKSGPKK
ncbi:RteC domain-containing protein [Mucilaginibacter lacusdianchii]|uniref:RteC domain-containing protein n=1 Tax=Mucilaginibacter lacusdianchii TaxID=2684211 RepID=UPI00131E86EE|nr:RteC domain-containing protein [Mucilaginibacter sp. JXJ CY 39]